LISLNKIKLGVASLIAVSKAKTVFDQTKWFPFILSAFNLTLGVLFFTAISYGFSVGSIEIIEADNIDGGYVKTIYWNQAFRSFGILFFIVYHWWILVVNMIQESIIAFSMAYWYFEFRKETCVIPLKKLVKSVFAYHMGSIILLSFSKLVFTIPRIMFANLRRVLRNAK